MNVEVLNEGPDRVVLGPDAEAAVVQELLDRGAERVMLVCSQGHPEGAARLAGLLGDRWVGTFETTRPQVPGDVADAATEQAERAGADWVLAHGGGTPIGVAKAVALARDIRVAAVPTTFAGSERTDIWGLTRDGEKTTGRDARVRPRVVGYDPSLLTSLPAKSKLQSLLNALAHAVDALYDDEATSHEAARAAVSTIWQAIGALASDDPEALTLATRGAWHAAEALNGAAMALHHKLAHVLGGSHDLPHAPTHAALLPHTLQFNLAAADEVRQTIAGAWGTDDPAAALYDRMRDAGIPVSLRELELPLEALDAVAEGVLQRRYTNPRSYDRATLDAFLLDLWQGRRPSFLARRGDALGSGGAHGAQLPSHYGPEPAEAECVLVAVHGRGANADRFAADLRARMGPELAGSTHVLALQADRCTWYPRGYLAPVDQNRPQIDHALAALDAAFAKAAASGRRVVVAGFSQGACLVLTWLQSTSHRPTDVLAFTGAHTPLEGDWAAAAGAVVHLCRSERDPWIERAPFDATCEALATHGATVERHQVPGDAHTLHEPDVQALRRALEPR